MNFFDRFKARPAQPIQEATPVVTNEHLQHQQAEPVVKKQWEPPLTPARWGVQEEYSTGSVIITWACPHKSCGQSGRFVGVKPGNVHLLRAWHCGHVGGEAVPQEIAERYAAINKPAAPIGEYGSAQENIDAAADLAKRRAQGRS